PTQVALSGARIGGVHRPRAVCDSHRLGRGTPCDTPTMSDLRVREWGNGGTPILFWHALGQGASGASISIVAPVLAGRGFPVVALDGPGFGDSPLQEAERYAIGALA